MTKHTARTATQSAGANAASQAEAAEAVERSRLAAHRANAALRAFTLVNDETFRPDASLPLNGLPLGVKDLYDTAGLPTTYGSPIYRDHVPAKDAAMVARLRQLGAFVVGKTITTEFAWRQAGPTVNPYNAAHTPGGSSSGSAAAVAAGIVPLALGTQTFGSIVRPAAFCGVFGFKPTYGTLPLTGVQPLSQSLDHAGYLARNVDIVQRVHGLAVDSPAGSALDHARRLRLVRGPYWQQATDTQREHIERVVAILRAAGMDVQERELPARFETGFAIAETILRREAAVIYRPLVDRWPDLVSGHIRELVEEGERLDDAAYAGALERRDELKAGLEAEIGDFDAIVTLPALGEAPLLTEGTGNPGPCVLWTLLGVPTASVPAGFGSSGLPLGIQLVAARGRDFELLDICAGVEGLLKG